MAPLRASVLRTSLLGVLLLLSSPSFARSDDVTDSDTPLGRYPRRIVSFLAPRPPVPSSFKEPEPLQPHQLVPIPSQPAPVHEEQNEPPPPPSRVRAPINPQMINPAGFASDAANRYLAGQSPITAAQVPSGVVQVLNVPIPNTPPRIVNPPPPETIPTQDIQPFSVDPISGQPLRTVSPKFRALLSPNAAPVNVPNPVNIPNFGRGFGGASILDVTGERPQNPQPQPQIISANDARFLNGGGANFQSFSSEGPSSIQSFGNGESTRTSQSFGNLQNGPQSFSSESANSDSSSYQSLGGPSNFQSFGSNNDDGDILSVQTFGGASSSANSNSQSFGSTPILSGELQSHSSPSGGSSHSVVTSHSLPGTGSSYSSTVYHGSPS